MADAKVQSRVGPAPSARLTAMLEALPDIPKPVVQMIDAYALLSTAEKLKELRDRAEAMAWDHNPHGYCEWVTSTFRTGGDLRAFLIGTVPRKAIDKLRATVSPGGSLSDGTALCALRISNHKLLLLLTVPNGMTVEAGPSLWPLLTPVKSRTDTHTMSVAPLFALSARDSLIGALGQLKLHSLFGRRG